MAYRAWQIQEGPITSHPIKAFEAEILINNPIHSVHIIGSSDGMDAGWGGECGIVAMGRYGTLKRKLVTRSWRVS